MSCPSRNVDFVLCNVSERSSISHDSAAPVVSELGRNGRERGLRYCIPVLYMIQIIYLLDHNDAHLLLDKG